MLIPLKVINNFLFVTDSYLTTHGKYVKFTSCLNEVDNIAVFVSPWKLVLFMW